MSDAATLQQTKAACCAPAADTARKGIAAPAVRRQASAHLKDAVAATLVPIKGGFFEMGGRTSRYEADLDSPARRVAVSDFRIARFTVTNAIFAAFVAETGYRTTAEREGWSFVFHLFLDRPQDHILAPAHTPWWRQVPGATWSAPEGPGSTLDNRQDHPVTHISWQDAQAFCDFTGTRLPSEAEWEYAARGKRKHARFPWGNDPAPKGQHRHNVWQGTFPMENTAEDGFAGTAPVGTYAPNDFGLFNMTGNVWEWCADWFGPLPDAKHPPLRDPKGAATGDRKVMRGGSHLCHPSYCERFYVHSRSHNTPDSSTGNIGFRIAA